jgi:hypothetical protein
MISFSMVSSYILRVKLGYNQFSSIFAGEAAPVPVVGDRGFFSRLCWFYPSLRLALLTICA